MAPADLRLRLLAAFIAIGCLSQLHSLAVAGGLLALVLPLAWVFAPLAFPWRRLWHLEGFLLLLFATLPFTVEGHTLFALGPFTASQDGLWRAALIAAKVSTCVLVLTALLGNVEPSRLGVALRGLRVPERLTRLCVMTMRYTSLLRDEARRLHDAMRARGFRPRSSRHTWRSYGNLIGMLLVRALDRAERVEEAMLCRGYTGSFPYHAPPFPPLRDWIGFGAISAAGVAVLVIDRL